MDGNGRFSPNRTFRPSDLRDFEGLLSANCRHSRHIDLGSGASQAVSDSSHLVQPPPQPTVAWPAQRM